MLSLNTFIDSQYYHAILGGLYQKTHHPELARQHYNQAVVLTNSKAEQALLKRKLDDV